MTTKDEAEQKEAPISDLEITGTLIQARDAMAPMRGLILFDQAIERINKLLAQQKEAQQEPVAWRIWSPDGTNVYQYTEDGDGETLYTSPPNHTAAFKLAIEALEYSRDDVCECLNQIMPNTGFERYDKRIAAYQEQLIKHDAAIAACREVVGNE